MSARFRVELEGAPWVYASAETATDAVAEAARMLERYSTGERAVFVHDFKRDTSRTFVRDGREMLERLGRLRKVATS